MKSLVTTFAIVALISSVTLVNTIAADAKPSSTSYINKKDRKDPIRKSFIVGSYKFTCTKWGDCYNISTK